MAETLGTGEVLVTANVEAALTSIARVSDALDALSAKADLSIRVQGMPDSGGGDKGKGGNGGGGRTPSYRQLGELEISDQLRKEMANIPTTINVSDIAEQIQTAIDDGAPYTIKTVIELDTVAIQKQFDSMSLKTPVQATSDPATPATPAAAPLPTITVSSAAKLEINKLDDTSLTTAIASATQLTKLITGQNIKVGGGDEASPEDKARFFAQVGMALGYPANKGFIGRGAKPGVDSTVGNEPFRKSTQPIVDAAVKAGMSEPDARLKVNEIAGLTSRVLATVKATQPPPPADPAPAPVPAVPPPVMHNAVEASRQLEQFREAGNEKEILKQVMAEAAAAVEVQSYTLEQIVGGIGPTQPGGTKTSGPAARNQDPILTYIGATGGAKHRRSAGTRPLQGGGQLRGVDVTAEMEAAARGAFHGLAEVPETGELIPRARDPEKGTFVQTRTANVVRSSEREQNPNAVGIQQRVRPVTAKDVLRRVLQIRTGGEISQDEIDILTQKGTEGKTAPRVDQGNTTLPDDAIGMFAPFLEQGTKAFHTRGPLPGGHQGFMTPQLDALVTAARDALALTGGSGVPLGQARQSPDTFQSTAAGTYSAANQVVTNRKSRARQLSEQFRTMDPMGLTHEQMGKVIGERAGQQLVGKPMEDAMADLATLYDALLDPSRLPTVASEKIGKFAGPQATPDVTMDQFLASTGGKNEGPGGMGDIWDKVMRRASTRGDRNVTPEQAWNQAALELKAPGTKPGESLTTYQGLEFRMNQIMAATGLPAMLGIENPSIQFGALANQLGQHQGGQVPADMLRAIRDKRFQQSELEQNAADQAGITENSKIAANDRIIAEYTPVFRSVGRRQKLDVELSEYTGEGGRFAGATDSEGNAIGVDKRILSRTRGRHAKAAMEQAMEENRLEPGSLGRVSTDARKVVEERAKEIVEKKAAPEIAKAAEEQKTLEQKISRERQIERMSLGLVDSLRDPTNATNIQNVRDRMASEKAGKPTEGPTSGIMSVNELRELTSIMFAEGVDPAGEPIVGGAIDQAAQDVFTAQGNKKKRPASRTAGFLYQKPKQYDRLEQHSITPQPKGGQQYRIDSNGQVIPITSSERTEATRVGPGSSDPLLFTPDEIVEKSAARAGKLAPRAGPLVDQIIEERKYAAIEDAVNVATDIDATAGAMTVTIASPIPLPVIIVGGGGGGGGGKPPKTGGTGGTSGGDDGDEKVSRAERLAKEPGEILSAGEALARNTAILGEGQAQAQIELEGRHERRQRSQKQKLGSFSSFDEADAARNAEAANDPSQDFQVSRTAEGFDLTRRVPGGLDIQTSAGLEAERLGDAQTKREEAEAKKRTRAGVQERKVGVSTAKENLVGLRQREDPQRDAQLDVFREANNIPAGQTLTPQEEIQFASSFGASKGIVTDREKKAAASLAAGQTGPNLKRQPPSAQRLQQLIQTAGDKTGSATLRAGLPQAELTPADVVREQDEGGVLVAQQEARASLRQARGRIPQRALSTSIVQIAENVFGGVEGPLGRIAQAEQEFGQLGQLGREQGKIGREGRLIERQLGVAQEAQTVFSGDKTSDEFLDLEAATSSLTEKLKDNGEEFDEYGKAIEDQVGKVQRLSKAAVTTTDVFRNLGAGFIGAIGGQLVTQAVSVAAAAITGAAELAAPTVDVILGSGVTSQREQRALATAFQQGGFGENQAISQQYVAAGFSTTAIGRFQETIDPGAEAIARADQLDRQLQIRRTEDNREDSSTIAAYGAGAGAQVALNTDFFGAFQFDIGGSDAVAKSLSGLINQGADDPEAQARRASRYLRDDYLSLSGTEDQEARFRSRANARGVSQAAQASAISGDLVASFEGLPTRLDEILNQNLRDTKSRFEFMPGRDPALMARLDDLGNTFQSNLAPSLRDNNLRIATTRGPAFDLDRDFPDLVKAMTDLSPKAAAQVTVDSPEFKNNLFAFEEERKRSRVAMQIGVGFQGRGNQILAAGTGVAGGEGTGRRRGGSVKFQSEFDTIAASAQAFEDQGIDMLKALMPTDLLDEYTLLGDRLKEIGEETGNIQVAQQMRSYAISVKQARFAVEDLTAITGKGIGSNIGMMERENMLMQRRLQTLQFEQQQRGINFGVAIAGFQTEGATGAERGARLRVAREEAAVQQEMLDLSKGMFGNQVQIVDQRNLRELSIATASLNNIVLSFQENIDLSEMARISTVSARRMNQIESLFAENMQTQLTLEAMRIAFLVDVANATQKIASDLDLAVIKPFDETVKTFSTDTGFLAEVASTLETDVVNPFSSSVKEFLNEVSRLDELLNGKRNPLALVKNVTIKQDITGTVVDYKTLVDLIVEELGKQAGRTGHN